MDTSQLTIQTSWCMCRVQPPHLPCGSRMLLTPPSLTLIFKQRLDRVCGVVLCTFFICTHCVAIPSTVSPTRLTSAVEQRCTCHSSQRESAVFCPQFGLHWYNVEPWQLHQASTLSLWKMLAGGGAESRFSTASDPCLPYPGGTFHITQL